MKSDSEDNDIKEGLQLVDCFLPEQKKKKVKVGGDQMELTMELDKSLKRIDDEYFFKPGENKFHQEQHDFTQFIKENDKKNDPKKKKFVKVIDTSAVTQNTPVNLRRIHPNTHKSPEQIFYYFGLKINVLYTTYLKTSAKALVIPIRSENQWSDLPSVLLSNRISEQIKQSLNKTDYLKADEDVFCVRSEQIFYDRNYPWTYIFKFSLGKFRVKKPTQILKESFEKVLDEMLKNNIESIVVPKFRWCQSLSYFDKAQVIFDSILMYFKGKVRSKSSSLREITICIHEMTEYMAFVKVLRKITDEFIETGNIVP